MSCRFSPPCELLVDGGVLPGHTDELPDLMRLAGDIDAEDLGMALIDVKQGGQHIDHRRLACTVGAEDSEDLAPTDVKVDMVNGRVVAEGLDQPPDPHRRGGRRLCLCLPSGFGVRMRDGLGVMFRLCFGHDASVHRCGFTTVSGQDHAGFIRLGLCCLPPSDPDSPTFVP